MTVIDKAAAVDLLKAAVEAKGEDYAYPLDKGVCQYFFISDKTPACIVGTGLALKYGTTYDQVKDCNEATVKKILDRLDIDVTFDALELLNDAQEMQDNGHQWGEVLSVCC